MKKTKILIIALIITNILTAIGLGYSIYTLFQIKEACSNAQAKHDESNEELTSEKNKLEEKRVTDKNNAEKLQDSDEDQIALKSDSNSSKTEQLKINRKVSVCLDAGHGITSKGGTEAISPNSQAKKAAHVSGTAGEEEFNLDIAKRTKEILESCGVTVDMTRTESHCDKSNIDRANQGNENDYCIRIHADGSENKSLSGISVLIPEKSYFGDKSFVQESTSLGQFILAEAIKNTGAKNKGLITRGDLTGFNWSKVPSVLIECGYMTNPTERALLDDSSYRQSLALAIANGFINYLNSKS